MRLLTTLVTPWYCSRQMIWKANSNRLSNSLWPTAWFLLDSCLHTLPVLSLLLQPIVRAKITAKWHSLYRLSLSILHPSLDDSRISPFLSFFLSFLQMIFYLTGDTQLIGPDVNQLFVIVCIKSKHTPSPSPTRRSLPCVCTGQTERIVL